MIFDLNDKSISYYTVMKIKDIKTYKDTILIKFYDEEECDIFKIKDNGDWNEIHTFILGEKNGVYQVIDRDGKVGLFDENLNAILPFEYDSFKASKNKAYEENTSKNFITLEKNGKFGIFNTIDKKLIIPCVHDGFILNGKVDSDSYVTSFENGTMEYLPKKENELYRFLFLDKDDKVGVINSNNHIVLNPILTSYDDNNEKVRTSERNNVDKWEYSKLYLKKSDKAFDEDEILISMSNPYLLSDLNNEKVKENYNNDFDDMNSKVRPSTSEECM